MEAIQQHAGHLRKENLLARSLLIQDKKNTTLWIGHFITDPIDHFAGQTFTCSRAGLLDNIQLYSLAVYSPGNVDLTLHEFDTGNKTWGPAIACCSRLIQKDDEARWVRFDPGPVLLTKDETYGFRVQTTDALIGFGEAVTSSKYPFTFGHEWNGNSGNKKGYFLSYFSFAFKIEHCE